uniref:Uncharacterized protein n=2 Tax=Alexandrium monilatum TaxID=311494 RepID=A0A7S4RHC3_9DINO
MPRARGGGGAALPGSGVAAVQPKATLCALGYHLRSARRLLEQLDLPLAHLQELRRGCRQRRPIPGRAAAPVGAAGRRHWQRAEWGPLCLLQGLSCSAWQPLWDAARLPGPQTHGTRSPAAAGAAEGRPEVSCFGPDEAALVAEVELHVCAAIRHLARASNEEGAAAWHSPGASRGCVEFEAVDPLSPAKEGMEEACSLSPKGGVQRGADGRDRGEGADRADANGKGGGMDMAAAEVHPTPAFAKALERLVLLAWTFFVHAQLMNALLRGDVMCCVAWALRFMGVGDPWSLRRIHELVVNAFEVLVEHPRGPEDDDAGTEEGCGGNPPELRFLHEACAVYLRLPVIPRFEVRLRRSVADLCELGLLQQGSGNDLAPEEGGRPGLPSVIAALLDPEMCQGEASLAYGPDESPETLQAARADDGLHMLFRRRLLEAMAEHLEEGTVAGCALEARRRLLCGAEALALLQQGGGAWPGREKEEAEEAARQGLLPEVLASVPQPPPPQRLRARSLAELEERGNEEHSGLQEGIGPEDVLLDVWADLREFEALSRLVARDNCGFCCSSPGRHPVH